MTLKQLIQDLPELVDTRGDMGVPIEALQTDSRKACHSGLFFCIPGGKFDGHAFAGQAVANGCVALVAERPLPDVAASQVLVSDVRVAMARLAAAFYGYPAKGMKLVGVTGTKGKTTTTYLIKAICERAGFLCGLVGTTGNMIGERTLESDLTTPDPVDLQRTLREMADAGVQVVSMEISAHALALRKLIGLQFEVAAYTNLSQDHLDFFGTMDAYLQAKRLLFTTCDSRNAAYNADEETSKTVLAGVSLPAITFGIRENCDLYARDIEISEDGVSFALHLRNVDSVPIRLRLTGTFNVYNAMAAAAVALILGIDLRVIKQGLESVVTVPGRVEMLDTRTPYRMILDYSHSPDALENILRTVREFTRGRLIALFGCGGDRDQGKRALMGRIGGELADFSILTSDNPRREDPFAILASVEEGIRQTEGEYVVIENRRDAIRYAMDIAREGDVVVLAGKGHETYQEINGVKFPFDEKVVVRELLHIQ
ncbi:MAG: UDP-N-acetylmuramoyl-L-alanyl-D-glutamate--2,6-diaminopimelate ligase [Oscillospiraceae bacterium]|jgi:UDP-N-acetylmuramoyl-L-alanyl-D-glutamate--2,6-diaminopimelate ligase|nr:UDP-N-acetylmuramoyl-L-alanyl-D-glutamate--2,6-diaminopimelate ligase [Oscillospiraceae bacterium]